MARFLQWSPVVGVGHVVVFLVRHPAEGSGDAMRHDFAVQGLLARRRYRLDAPDSRETVPVTGGRRPGAEVYVGDLGPYPVTLAWSSQGEFLDACRALAPHVEPTGFLVRDHYAVRVEDGECRVTELDGRPWTEVLVSQCPPDAAWSLLLHEPRACVRGERPVREGVLDQARAALAVAPEVSSGSAAHEARVLAARLLLLLGRPEEAVPYAEETAYADGGVPARVRADAYAVLGRVWEHAGEGRKALEALRLACETDARGTDADGTGPGGAGLAQARAEHRRALAVALARAGRPAEAEALLMPDGFSGLTFVEAARALVDLDEADTARALLRAGLALDPGLLAAPGDGWPRPPDLSWALMSGFGDVLIEARASAMRRG
ncbi:hypothetical protein [Streptomyces sp. NBC_01314]|uniref:hypothetical protein n=1 Tax=Streptomyces sp. NBC_01314 TaxID=2903821 RepID=UPI003089413A|nr:hypothetical protein OG622_12840 [Streptomyces sp. NBC_01314]